MDQYAKVQPGDSLPGLPYMPWNDMLDVIAATKTGELRKLIGQGMSGYDAGSVPIRNDSGSAVDRFGILGITGFLIDPATNLPAFKNRPVLTGDAPVASDQERFAILQQPCDAGAIADGLLVGLTPVRISVIDTSDDYCDLIAGDTTFLESGPCGSDWIVYKQPGEGIVWGLVVHGVQGSQFVLGKTSGAINKGSSGTVDLYRGTTAGSEFNGATSVEAYNHFADVGDGKWVLCVYVQRNFRIVAAEC